MRTTLFDPIVDTTERALDLRARRAELLSANLANVDTPGYVPRKLDFEESLRQEFAQSMRRLGTSDAETKVPVATVQPEEAPDCEPNQDGNAVDLDQEMLAFSENAELFRAGTTIIERRMALVRYALGEAS